jgi:hypothetical protein
MSFEVFLQCLAETERTVIPRPVVRSLFPVIEAESEPDRWRVRYDDLNYCDVNVYLRFPQIKSSSMPYVFGGPAEMSSYGRRSVATCTSSFEIRLPVFSSYSSFASRLVVLADGARLGILRRAKRIVVVSGGDGGCCLLAAPPCWSPTHENTSNGALKDPASHTPALPHFHRNRCHTSPDYAVRHRRGI